MSINPSGEPFWARAGNYRFDAPAGMAVPFGVCYAGDSVETAFAESVIHTTPFGGTHCVSAIEWARRQPVGFAMAPGHRRKRLKLVDFAGAALKRLGLNNDICASDDYRIAQAWAAAIHASSPQWDGLRDVSRQCNTGFAVALFDRAPVRCRGPLPFSAAERQRLCRQFNVQLIGPPGG